MSNRLLLEELSGDRVRVGLRRTGHNLDEWFGKPIAFIAPLSLADHEDLRWYLEDYLIAPFAVYEEHGQQIAARLPHWGEALFEAVFGAGKPGRDAYLQAREGACALSLRSASPAFLSLPWELLQDPQRPTPLALELSAIDRTLVAAGTAVQVPPGEVLRVLMVIARPAGVADVGYQMIARPLVERLAAVRGEVALEVLRPPTLEALRSRLQAAAAEGRSYHILHFDGHGTFGQAIEGGGGPYRFDSGAEQRGYLAFEAEGGGDDLVPAEAFALTVNQARVPLVVLNACRSAMVGEAAVEAAVATRLLEGGAASVVAMGYSVYAVAAAEFMAAFYEALFARKSVSEAVSKGRRRLYRRKERPSPKGMLPLEDWIVPVHYLRRAIRFAGLKPNKAPGALSLDTLLDQMRPSGSAAPGGAPASDPLAPVGRFVGRDAAFYTLELALKWQRVVVVHGPAGTGKTELAKAFGRWWQTTGGVENPDWVVLHSFEPGVASFGLDGVITALGLHLFGPDFIGRTQDAAQRCELILRVLREHRLLWIWDNFESVRELPDPTGATPALDAAEQRHMRDFLGAVARDGQSGIIITSRTPEDWLGDVRRLELGGLMPGEAAEMAEDVLRPYPRGRTRRNERAFAELMEWLGGHPLSLRLLLPQLERVSAEDLLAALKGTTRALPAGFVGEGRLASLGISLKYSLDHVTPDERERALALALFEGVVDENVLTVFAKADGVPARFAQVIREAWSALLTRLAGIGVLTELGGSMYGLHPALPAYLMAEWRRLAGEDFAAEHAAAEHALLAAYVVSGNWLLRQIQSGAAEAAFVLLDRQRHTMGRLLGLALTQRRCSEAQVLMQPLNEFWNARGLRREARSWVYRCRAVLEDKEGTPPDLAGEAGALWLFAIGSEARRALEAGELDLAYRTYDAIRQKLEAFDDPKWQWRLAVVYHQLGVVAQERGDLAAAEGWYRKALEIEEALGNRPGLARSYHQLGMVAQERGDLAAAEGWYRKALEIREALGDRPGLASSYHQLGVVAQERGDLAAAEGWYRKALEIFEALGNRPGLASSYHQLGRAAQERGDLAAAEGWYRKALEIREALGDRPGLASSYHQLGRAAQERGDLAAAEAWYRNALEIREALGDQPGLAVSYHQFGTLAQERGDLAAAEAWYRKTLDIESALNDQQGLASTFFQLGALAIARGCTGEARNWYEKAATACEETVSRTGLPDIYLQLADLTYPDSDRQTSARFLVKALRACGDRGPSKAKSSGPLRRIVAHILSADAESGAAKYAYEIMSEMEDCLKQGATDWAIAAARAVYSSLRTRAALSISDRVRGQPLYNDTPLDIDITAGEVSAKDYDVVMAVAWRVVADFLRQARLLRSETTKASARQDSDEVNAYIRAADYMHRAAEDRFVQHEILVSIELRLEELRCLERSGAWTRALAESEQLHQRIKMLVGSSRITEPDAWRLKAALFSEMAGLMRQLGDYERAANRLKDAQRAYRRVQDAKGEGKAMIEEAILTLQQGLTDDARRVLENAQLKVGHMSEFGERLTKLFKILDTDGNRLNLFSSDMGESL